MCGARGASWRRFAAAARGAERAAAVILVHNHPSGDPAPSDDDRAVTEQLVPGRWNHVRGPTRKELAATTVLELPLAEASVKVRTGPPKDDPEDYDTGIWAGVLPARLTFGAAEPDPALPSGVTIPDHISALAGRPRDALT